VSQEFEHITIFAGAGASCAVDQKKYPTTVGFMKDIDHVFKGNRWLSEVRDKLVSMEKSGVLDVEVLLSELASFETTMRRLCEPNGISAFAFRGNRFAQLLNRSVDTQSTLSFIDEVRSHVDSAKTQIENEVYRIYSREPEVGSLNTNWLPLLRTALKLYKNVEVFTTNYDLVIEHAIADLKLAPEFTIETGRQGLPVGLVDMKYWGQSSSADPTSKRGLLTKLHGSIDWSKAGTSGIRLANPTDVTSTKRDMLLFPGFKGIPTQEPFNVFHRHLAATLRKTELVVVIGFAFRDEHINDIFRENLSNEAQISVVDVVDRKSLPFDSRRSFDCISTGFNDQGVRWITEIIKQRGINI
jgi:hypothetical protein